MGEERNFPGMEWGGGGDWSFPGKEAGPQEGARSGRAGHVGRKGSPFFSWPPPGLGPGFRRNSAACPSGGESEVASTVETSWEQGGEARPGPRGCWSTLLPSAARV